MLGGGCLSNVTGLYPSEAWMVAYVDVNHCQIIQKLVCMRDTSIKSGCMWRRTEALGVELVSDGADARLARLLLLQLAVQVLLW